ncbi:hypothetical protein TSOC_000096 [Tetrabaena socialis]|uniref:phytol kinase n=1 Tax=Tetrabaena socialis TaxID=47790 RepID=A0A2J8AK59_9CHLO|nr:hypothetical protein TSOC_000096 [Tetrabaena socialis]|eukprot:PNH12905.1 hypothetical protein TSOC_000096 [Tetrabaena socialis]
MRQGRSKPSRSESTRRQATGVLDQRVKYALRRLPALVNGLLAVPDDRAQSAPVDDVEELAELLKTVNGYLAEFPGGSAEGAAAAASIFEDAAVHSALLRLVAAVLRWPLPAPISNQPSRAGGATNLASGGTIGGGHSGSTSTGGSGSGGSATGGNGSGSDTGGSNGGSTEKLNGKVIQAYAGVARGACCVAYRLLRLLLMQPHVLPAVPDFVQKLLRMHTLQCLARQFAAAAGSLGALTAQQARYVEHLFFLLDSLLLTVQLDIREEGKALRASMCRELAEALRDSCVLEHAARLLLRLMLQGAPTGAALSARNDMADTSYVYLGMYQNINSFTWTEGPNAAACAALREVLSGRCARHVVLIHGVAALCMADGGPAYGLPEDVQQAVNACLAGALPPGRQEVHHRVEAISFALLAAVMAALGNAASSPPVGERAAVVLLLRLARLAVTSADVWAARAQQQLAGLPTRAGGARLVVPRDKVVAVAQGALDPAWRLLRERLAANPPAWAQEAGVECWRLVAALLGQNMLRTAGPASPMTSLTGRELLHRWVPLLPTGEPLPSAPPPGLAAVLAGGLLPCLERLLRRGGAEPNGPESLVLGALLRSDHAWHLWAHLLEYGEPRQAAALVATLGKLLRRTNGAEANPLSVIRLCSGVLEAALFSCCDLWVTEGRQLARLLTYALCEWLPALSSSVLEVMAGQAAPGREYLSGFVLQTLLRWLPLLASRPGGGGGMAEAGAFSEEGDAGGWRLLLLEEVRVVALLGGALRLAPVPGADVASACALAQCCCIVAAVFPDEVLRAASSSSAWSPKLLRALLPEMRAQGFDALVDCTETLAAMLEGGGSGGSSSGDIHGRGGGGNTEARGRLLAYGMKAQADCFKLAAALVSPAEARALLRTCSYPGCISLAGDSEADARMRWCRFCSVPCYCCGECQLSHWQEGGHKEACPGGAKARPG